MPVRREAVTFRKAAQVVKAGEPAPGLIVILSGEVEVTQHDGERGTSPDRHPRARLVHGRAGAAFRAAVAGRRGLR